MSPSVVKGKRELLNSFYQQVKTIILSKQNAATGLIPASVAITTHGDYTDAWVRDNVYSILAVWALGLAYRRVDDELGRAYEMENATVKCMRGLLSSMMRQANKVESFKKDQSPSNALHAKYSTTTGATVVADHEWGHLQVDATSIFLLMLAQMTASGLNVIFTMDEVNFVQNLVFYIERAYRTPDYGIWERGNKINHGMPELNSSSIGMAVAALQAINGQNMFGARGGSSSVIHVLPDEIIRNHTTLHSALPRESYSKEIDASLLSVISYPGFALHDTKLINLTKNEIIRKLEGKYGCKRFLRDGHQTVLEDHSRLHYEPSELKIFEHIECEWPLFFTYLILDGQFNNNEAQVDNYRSKLEPLLVDSATIPQYNRAAQNHSDSDGNESSSFVFERQRRTSHSKKDLPPAHMLLVPELYIVPSENIPAEREKPTSQERYANENVPLVWAQSLKIVGNLIHEKLIDTADIDPLGKRFLPYINQNGTDTIVQVVLLAENAELQAKMAMFGLDTQTIESCQPITVSTPSALRDAYTTLGENRKMGLTGRPRRPVGTLSTSKLYRCQGRLYAFLPHFMDREEFYLVSDNDYLVTVFEQELAFVRNNWSGTGRPTMTVLLTREMLGGLRSTTTSHHHNTRWGHGNVHNNSKQKKNLLDFMMTLRTGNCGGVRVRLGRLHEMVNTSQIESLDFLVSTENGEEEDWHSVLRSNGLSLLSSKKSNFSLSEADHVAAPDTLSGATSNSRRQKSFVRKKSSDSSGTPLSGIATSEMSPQKSPLCSPFFSEQPVEYEGGVGTSSSFKLNDHVDVKNVLSKTLSPPRGTGTRTNPGSLAASPSDNSPRRPSFQFEIENNVAGGNTNSAVDTATGNPVVGSDTTQCVGEEGENSRVNLDLHHKAASNSEVLTLTLNDPTNVQQAIELLRNSSNLFDQIGILHYLHSIEGGEMSIYGLSTVNNLIEEVYIKAMHLRRWSVVRQAAGLLRKVVNNLSINISELLIRQTPLTIGFGKSEYFIMSPMAPSMLIEVLYEHCQGDIREAPLVQEIITYLGSFIRSSGSLLDGIKRVRTHFFIIAMREEISRMKGCDEEEAIELLMQLSPYEMKSLLGQVLSAAEHLNLEADVGAGNVSVEDRWSDINKKEKADGIANSLSVKLQSAGFFDGNFASIEVVRDGIPAKLPFTFSRGVNVVVIDPLDGVVVEMATFDTHQSNDESEEFARMIDWLEPGMIVACLGKDDVTENMNEAAKNAAEMVGSRAIRNLDYRDSWCLIGEKIGISSEVEGGGHQCVESHNGAKKGPAAVVEQTFDLVERRRRAFAILPKNADLNSKALFLTAGGPNMNLFLPSHGRWLRRRKNDGALNRVPPVFYPKVWTVLSKCEGILVGGEFLPRDPTISEKTPEEFSFGLQFESLLDVIRDPAERQIAIDCLVVIYWLGENNPKVAMNTERLNLLKIIEHAVKDHWDKWVKAGLQQDESMPSSVLLKNRLSDPSFEKNHLFARRLFFDLPRQGSEGTNAFLAHAIGTECFGSRLDLGNGGFYDVDSDFCEFVRS